MRTGEDGSLGPTRGTTSLTTHKTNTLNPQLNSLNTHLNTLNPQLNTLNLQFYPNSLSPNALARLLTSAMTSYVVRQPWNPRMQAIGR
jgi:hypothetical protein